MVAADRTTTLTTHREVRRVAVAAAIGHGLEYYDWFLYGLFAALVAGKLFFPTMDPIVGTLAAFLTFALGSVARPLGGIFFGHIGDRYGRKVALIGTITLMGLSTGAIGLLPTYEAVGVAAPILLSTLRLLQGFSVGGEWAGAVSLTMEHASSTHRGRWLGLVLLGSQLGALASTGIFALLSRVLTQEQFSAVGWRIPFLVGFLLLGIGIYDAAADRKEFTYVPEGTTGKADSSGAVSLRRTQLVGPDHRILLRRAIDNWRLLSRGHVHDRLRYKHSQFAACPDARRRVGRQRCLPIRASSLRVGSSTGRVP